MSFQKCPLCLGEGSNACSGVCPTCKGQRIIHDVTGLPPGEPSHGLSKVWRPEDSPPPDVAQSEPTPFDKYTDEDVLFYATPYFDELQARKNREPQGDK